MSSRRPLPIAVGLLCAVVMPALGYAELLASHEASWRTWVLVPASVAGPDPPGIALFVGLVLLHAVLWFGVGYGVARLVSGGR